MPDKYDSWSTATSVTVILMATHAAAAIFAAFALTGLQTDVALLLFIIGISALFGWVVARPMSTGFNRIEAVLRGLIDNKHVKELPVEGSEPLNHLTALVNRFVHQQKDMLQMRGQLYHQISEAAAQEERNRLARDLHDSIKQQIFSISVGAAAALARLESDAEGARAALHDVKQSAQEAMVEMRAMLQQLSPAPLEKSGLLQALRDQCEALAYRTSTQVKTDFGALPGDDLFRPGAQEALFRIAQEALSNVARHARAQNVRVTLKQEEQHIVLVVSDDGQGFDPASAPAGMGLGNIEQRASALQGRVTLASAPGEGTTLSVYLPLMTPKPQENAGLIARHNALIPSIVQWRYIFALATSAAIYSISLLVSSIVVPREDASGFIFTTIHVVLSLVTLISVPGATWAYLRVHRLERDIWQTLEPESVQGLRLRRHEHHAWAIVFSIAAWFGPMSWIGSSAPLWLTAVASVLLLGLALWHYVQALGVYNRTFALMEGPVLAQELQKRYQERFNGWVSLGFLLVVQFATGFWGEIAEVTLFPTRSSQWMTTFFLLAIIFMTLNLLYETWVYPRLRALRKDEELL
jgi:signal transduction histidine kinase